MIQNHLYNLSVQHTQAPQKNKTKLNQTFCGNFVDSLTHVNIGSKPDGYIGKISARLSNGQEAILNVFKKVTSLNHENYTIKNDYNELIGEMKLLIRKYPTESYSRYQQADPSNVFVDELRNYSRPDTPYYTKGLTYHKDIGTRLLQIAQRRSDEARCSGNIELISKNESLDWYLQYIGMRQEVAPLFNGKAIHSSNKLYLPPESKEALSKIRGGL